ncbi:hypothetical protein MRS44_003875 [Fusarium solani]|uniref:uncharacterized protein n=1 Tax=Fusarium solani TaxID=169388 RepID=UPI0032C3F793|nr:hypothetical protein MRS44_003875 [Fusarium solani]
MSLDATSQMQQDGNGSINELRDDNKSADLRPDSHPCRTIPVKNHSPDADVPTHYQEEDAITDMRFSRRSSCSSDPSRRPEIIPQQPPPRSIHSGCPDDEMPKDVWHTPGGIDIPAWVQQCETKRSEQRLEREATEC